MYFELFCGVVDLENSDGEAVARRKWSSCFLQKMCDIFCVTHSYTVVVNLNGKSTLFARNVVCAPALAY